jgi:pyruvate dehydrogenase E2 component (dihydrolipoamide acetyltransferase)
MAVTVSMPQLGETVTEGTILSWAKQVGDHVDEDEVLLEISTDKVDTEVPSPASGTLLEILVQEGETVSVGAALAVIGEAGEEPATEEPEEPEPEQPAAEEPAAEEPEEPAAEEPEEPEEAEEAEEPAAEEPEEPPRSRRPGRRPRRSRPLRHRPRRRPCPSPRVTPTLRCGASSRRWCAGSPPSTNWICRRSRAAGRAVASPART